MEAVKYINKCDYLEFSIINLKLINPKVNLLAKQKTTVQSARLDLRNFWNGSMYLHSVCPYQSIPFSTISWNHSQYQLRFRQKVKSGLFGWISNLRKQPVNLENRCKVKTQLINYLHLDIPKVLLCSTELWTDRTQWEPVGTRCDLPATLLWVCVL